MVEEPSPDFPEYNELTREVWDGIAEWWDDKIGDGNSFQNLLIEPATERLLQVQPGERLLDIACGAGRIARRMAALGASVVAIDHSAKFIQRARERTTENTDKIDYRILDASDAVALQSLGKAQFDAAVSTMSLMDMASIEPLISTLPRLLKPDGRFVFSVLHPAFNSGTVRLVSERYDDGHALVTRLGVTITDYATPFHYTGIGIAGQPIPHHYFHRPISLLFGTCFKHGFVLDGMAEPTLPQDSGTGSDSAVPRSQWHSMPPVLLARMRLTR